MKEFNKEEYNQMCAEFLGAVIEQPYPANKDYEQDGYVIYFPKDTVTLGIYRNYSLKGLKFDSDWNWIMEVKKAILDLELKISPQIHRVYFNVFSCRKNHPKFEYNYKVRLHTDFKDLEIKTESNDEKEAVVKAIYHFLNWYNEHISKTFR